MKYTRENRAERGYTSQNNASVELHNFEKELEIVNRYGIHLRPAGLFAKAALKYESDVSVTNYEGVEVSGKSITGLIALGAVQGTKIKIRISGNGDAEACRDELVDLVLSGFGEK